MDLNLAGIKNREVQALAAPRSSAEMAMRSRVLKLLISGATPKQVAESLGISESRISQFKSEEAFAKELQEGLAAKESSTANLNTKYDHLEELLINKLTQTVKTGELKFREMVHALQVVGSKKRTPLIETPDENKIQKVVHLHLVPRIAQKFILNQNKDVVGLGNQDFIPMSSQALLDEVKSHSNKVLEATDAIIEEAFQAGIEVTTNGHCHANQIEIGPRARTETETAGEVKSVSGSEKPRTSQVNPGFILEGDI